MISHSYSLIQNIITSNILSLVSLCIFLSCHIDIAISLLLTSNSFSHGQQEFLAYTAPIQSGLNEVEVLSRSIPAQSMWPPRGIQSRGHQTYPSGQSLKQPIYGRLLNASYSIISKVLELSFRTSMEEVNSPRDSGREIHPGIYNSIIGNVRVGVP